MPFDFWIAVSTDNAGRILKALKEFGFSNLDLSEADFLESNNIIQLGYEPNRIDILTSLNGVRFDECYEQSVEANFEGLKINFIDLKNLERFNFFIK